MGLNAGSGSERVVGGASGARAERCEVRGEQRSGAKLLYVCGWPRRVACCCHSLQLQLTTRAIFIISLNHQQPGTGGENGSIKRKVAEKKK